MWTHRQSTNKSKTLLHRRANDLLSTLAQNIDELKIELKDGKDGKAEKRKQMTVVQSFFRPAPTKPKHKPNVKLV